MRGGGEGRTGTIGPVSTETAAERVARVITRLVESGELAPGDDLREAVFAAEPGEHRTMLGAIVARDVDEATHPLDLTAAGARAAG